ncbi:MAG: hypothetical protein M3R15_13795 [Acidobacteriota bacterium]|nr:hypothetical protein [Acidobacteriota bacterium]
MIKRFRCKDYFGARKFIDDHGHQPTRVRERVMRRFKTAGQARAVPVGLRVYFVALSTTTTPADGRAIPGRDAFEVGDVG